MQYAECYLDERDEDENGETLREVPTQSAGGLKVGNAEGLRELLACVERSLVLAKGNRWEMCLVRDLEQVRAEVKRQLAGGE